MEMKVDYDEEFDDLYVYNSTRKAKFSINLDELVIDIDDKNSISGIEIMDAANTLSRMSPVKVDKNKLKNIVKAEMITRMKNNLMTVMMAVYFKEKNVEHKIPITIAMPSVR